jgi:hypothetical protein
MFKIVFCGLHHSVPAHQAPCAPIMSNHDNSSDRVDEFLLSIQGLTKEL